MTTPEQSSEITPIPAPPSEITDSDQLAAGEERWHNCPLKDCKRDVNLLYQDFYLRGIRTNRLLCSACAVRMEIGYIAREVDDDYQGRSYTASRIDQVFIFFASAIISWLVNTVFLFADFLLLGIFLGFAGGLLISLVVKRLTNRRVGRYSPQIGVSGVVLGFLLSPSTIFGLWFTWVLFQLASEIPDQQVGLSNFLPFLIDAYLPVVICTGIMAFFIYRNLRR
ncbi:MAG: hypothetical protein AAFV93_00310 [Chloroflexota bacterium]